MWKCLNSQCPDRAPVAAQQTCYTCGCVMQGKVMNLPKVEPSKVVASWNGVELPGYMDDHFLQVGRDEDGFKTQTGASGMSKLVWKERVKALYKSPFTAEDIRSIVEAHDGKLDRCGSPQPGLIQMDVTFKKGDEEKYVAMQKWFHDNMAAGVVIDYQVEWA